MIDIVIRVLLVIAVGCNIIGMIMNFRSYLHFRSAAQNYIDALQDMRKKTDK